jgi:hypothetical protein
LLAWGVPTVEAALGAVTDRIARQADALGLGLPPAGSRGPL